MTEVGLDRPDGEGLASGTKSSIDLPDGRCLYRIANRGAGAVRLDIVDLIGGKARAEKLSPEQP